MWRGIKDKNWIIHERQNKRFRNIKFVGCWVLFSADERVI